MNFLNEEYKVNNKLRLGSELCAILDNYKDLSVNQDEFNSLINGVYTLLFKKGKVYTLEELFEHYNAWDVRFLVKEGVLEGKLLTKEECSEIHVDYFLNSDEVVKERNEKLRSDECVCKMLKSKGSKKYREFIHDLVYSEKGSELKQDRIALFHYLLKRVREEDLGWKFIVPKTTKHDGAEDARFLENCVNGNALYLNHVLNNFHKSEVLRRASDYIEQNNVDVTLFPESYEGYKELVKIFKIKRSKSNYYHFKTFYTDFFPYLTACSMKNEGYDYERLMDEAHNMLYVFLCISNERSDYFKTFGKYYKRFYRACKKLEENE